MTAEQAPSRSPWPHGLAVAAASTAIVSGLLGLTFRLGAGNAPGWEAMSALSALCLVLLGVALALVTEADRRSARTAPERPP